MRKKQTLLPLMQRNSNVIHQPMPLDYFFDNFLKQFARSKKEANWTYNLKNVGSLPD
jgi:hypothetical protein